MKQPKQILLCLVLVLLLGCSGKDLSYKDHFDKGTYFYSQKDYDNAVKELSNGLEEAYKNYAPLSIIAQMHATRAVCYYYKGDYEKSWADVHNAERLKYRQFEPAFIEMLKKVSMREK